MASSDPDTELAIKVVERGGLAGWQGAEPSGRRPVDVAIWRPAVFDVAERCHLPSVIDRSETAKRMAHGGAGHTGAR
ncbi:hypothetical protein [Pseudofrankia saprophytica]|uniref:hypothetical protein n=1 Tax=Pseudofrankia saprophytica TaxID=298655 RepID=UPI0018E38B99|nr:hypothetical protein [Pseudofrankia saprophytica]